MYHPPCQHVHLVPHLSQCQGTNLSHQDIILSLNLVSHPSYPSGSGGMAHQDWLHQLQLLLSQEVGKPLMSSLAQPKFTHREPSYITPLGAIELIKCLTPQNIPSFTIFHPHSEQTSLIHDPFLCSFLLTHNSTWTGHQLPTKYPRGHNEQYTKKRFISISQVLLVDPQRPGT